MPTEQVLIGHERRHSTDHFPLHTPGPSPPAMAPLAPRALMGSNMARQGAHLQRAATEQAWPAPTSALLALAPAAESAPTPLLAAPLTQGPRLPRVSSLAASLLKLGAAWGVPAKQQQAPGMRRYQHAASTLAVQSANELEVRGGRNSLAQPRSSPFQGPAELFSPFQPRSSPNPRPGYCSGRACQQIRSAAGLELTASCPRMQDVAASMVLCEAIYRADDFGTEKVRGQAPKCAALQPGRCRPRRPDRTVPANLVQAAPSSTSSSRAHFSLDCSRTALWETSSQIKASWVPGPAQRPRPTSHISPPWTPGGAG